MEIGPGITLGPGISFSPSGPSITSTIDYLVVAGGGGGGDRHGGGGGAGGYRSFTSISVSLGSTYTATIGAGGIGLQWLDGNYYAGGGGGGWESAGGPETPGGLGGGGTGAWDDATITPGTTNTGGGGGGSRSDAISTTGRPGGSGVVIIRYPEIFNAATSTTGSPTVTTSGGYRYYIFTGLGSITI